MVRRRRTHEEEGQSTSEIVRDQQRGGAADNGGRKTPYEAPLLKRLGNIAEVTQGVHVGNLPDNTVSSL